MHNFALGCLRFFGANSPGRWFLSKSYRHDSEKLEREVFGITFSNPLGVAAGYDTDGRYCRELGAMGFGFVEVGTVTPRPQPGNMKPRIFRLPNQRAMINRTGQPNGGLEEVLENLRRYGNLKNVVVGVNIAANTLSQPEAIPGEYLKLFRSLYQYVGYFVVNVTSPGSNSQMLQTKETIGEILEGLFDFRRGQTDYRPILLKLSPDWDKELVDDSVEILIDTPLDGLVVAGGTLGRNGLDSADPKTLNSIGSGLMSGEPLLERTLELIKYTGEKMEWRYPIIASGGATRPEDVQRMLDAGASLVEVYTGIAHEGPMFAKRACKYCETHAPETTPDA